MSNPFFTCDPYECFRQVQAFLTIAGQEPAAVRIIATSPQEWERALTAIAASPASFVVYDGKRYGPDGLGLPYDPTKPQTVSELHLFYDIERIALDPDLGPRLLLFVHSPREWRRAKRAVLHLARQGLLQASSYIAFHPYKKPAQGISVRNLLLGAAPDGEYIAEWQMEMAYRISQDLLDLYE